MRERAARSALTPLTIDILSRALRAFEGSAARIGSGAMPPNVLSAKHWAFTSGYAGSESASAV